jgi:hypothetical protein
MTSQTSPSSGSPGQVRSGRTFSRQASREARRYDSQPLYYNPSTLINHPTYLGEPYLSTLKGSGVESKAPSIAVKVPRVFDSGLVGRILISWTVIFETLIVFAGEMNQTCSNDR